jgi:WhiB family transcriptional regulator, redox-sensing transcriptional regulator
MHEPVPTGMTQDDWRSLGACRHEDPELFFPIVQSGPGLSQISRAKAVCARCQVQADCLSFALETVQDYGVWGGTSEEERRAMRRSRIRRARAGAGGQQQRRSRWPPGRGPR